MSISKHIYILWYLSPFFKVIQMKTLINSLFYKYDQSEVKSDENKYKSTWCAFIEYYLTNANVSVANPRPSLVLVWFLLPYSFKCLLPSLFSLVTFTKKVNQSKTVCKMKTASKTPAWTVLTSFRLQAVHIKCCPQLLSSFVYID